MGCMAHFPGIRTNQVIMADHLTVSGPYSPSAELARMKPVPIAKLKALDSATGLAVADWLAQKNGA
ncbi:hypothetical protein DFAR_3280016 [Desulfarculales bacterium]